MTLNDLLGRYLTIILLLSLPMQAGFSLQQLDLQPARRNDHRATATLSRNQRYDGVDLKTLS